MKFHSFRPALLAAALAFAGVVHAAGAAPAVSPEKQKLIERVLALWHAEETAIVMVQRPAGSAIEQASIALQGRVSQQKHQAAMKDIAGDVQKYIDEATPIARDNAARLKAPVLAPLLAQNFSEDELRQLIALLESPVKHKFEQLLPQMERAYGERIAADSRAQIDPKLQTMKQAVALKLRAASMAPN